MSVSLSLRDPDYPWLRSDVSVGSYMSSFAESANTRRFAIGQSLHGVALYQSKKHQMPSQECYSSLQEVDDQVASETKIHHSDSSLDNGQQSPTSVSYVVSASGPPNEGRAIRQGSLPVHLRRVESASGRSAFSRSSRSSRGSKASRPSRRNRSGNLERKISQVLLCSASVASEYTTKDDKETVCRSAQFILTDLFYEAFKTKNESALPHPPFANGTSWSPLAESCLDHGIKPDVQRFTLPGPPPPRHLDARTLDQKQNLSSAALSVIVNEQNGRAAVGTSLEILPPYSAHIDVIKEAENESEVSSFLSIEPNEQSENVSLKRDNTKNAPEVTGTHAFSLDVGLFQYRSATLSQFSKGRELNLVQSTTEKKLQSSIERLAPKTAKVAADAWTSFDGSPFQNVTKSTYDFDIDTFLPFYSEEGDNPSRPAFTSIAVTALKVHENMPGWATSLSSSPSFPASVFNFSSTDDKDDYWDAAEFRSEALWG